MENCAHAPRAILYWDWLGLNLTGKCFLHACWCLYSFVVNAYRIWRTGNPQVAMEVHIIGLYETVAELNGCQHMNESSHSAVW
jgi:hypothetical protein